MRDREGLIEVISAAKGWHWCELHEDFFDGLQGEFGGHVGLPPDVLDALVAWANGGLDHD